MDGLNSFYHTDFNNTFEIIKIIVIIMIINCIDIACPFLGSAGH